MSESLQSGIRDIDLAKLIRITIEGPELFNQI